MCLKNSDLNIKALHSCYLTHPARNEDTDDVLLDTANQMELSKGDLIKWVTSKKSYKFMDEFEDEDLEVTDFSREFDPLLCA